MSEPLIAYWFAMADKQGRAYSPNKPNEKWTVGKKRTLNGEIIPCQYGFHGSPTLWQALEYARGPIACKVELGGTIVHGGDKLAASQKTLLAAVNVERELRLFAADCAEHAAPSRGLDGPDRRRPGGGGVTPTLAEGVVWRLSQLDADGLLVVDAVLQGLQRDPLIAPLLAGLLRTWAWEGMSAGGESRGEDAQVVRLEFRFRRES